MRMRDSFRAGFVLASVCAALAPACRQDMQDQPRYDTFSESHFFPDKRSERPQVPGTVARGMLHDDELLYSGRIDGQLADTFPFEITEAALERGRERYDIFCTPCHDATGSGNGMIVQRGMKRPPSIHIQRLREAPAGYYFDVMTVGFGAMFDFSDKITAADRWKITAYVRALQLSQAATIADVPLDERKALEGAQ